VTRASLEAAIPSGAEILLDTSVVLAYLNASEAATPAAIAVFDDFVRSGRNPATISVVSVAETLVRPFAAGAAAVRVADAFLLHFPSLTVSRVDYAVAREAARLRARTGVKMPDALVIATALAVGIPIVITNDAKWATAIADCAPALTLCHLDAHLPL
jgi:predicted nucleic acid-binding protein